MADERSVGNAKFIDLSTPAENESGQPLYGGEGTKETRIPSEIFVKYCYYCYI